VKASTTYIYIYVTTCVIRGEESQLFHAVANYETS